MHKAVLRRILYVLLLVEQYLQLIVNKCAVHFSYNADYSTYQNCIRNDLKHFRIELGALVILNMT